MSANFQSAYEKVLQHEGGYVNDRNDPGGETYKGVSRANWGTWQGWQSVDLAKRRPNFPANLDNDLNLQGLVKDFYRTEFWNIMNGDNISNQDVATAIFDFGVNAGIKTSITLAQVVVDTDPDGVLGDITLAALNNYDPHNFLAAFTLAKITRYINIVKRKPTSQKYFYGWVCRALDIY